MLNYNRKKSVLSQTMIWQRDKLGMWERHFVRVLSDGTLYWSRLHRVEEDLPVCMNCLSQDVDVMGVVDEVLRCRECGVSYEILEET